MKKVLSLLFILLCLNGVALAQVAKISASNGRSNQQSAQYSQQNRATTQSRQQNYNQNNGYNQYDDYSQNYEYGQYEQYGRQVTQQSDSNFGAPLGGNSQRGAKDTKGMRGYLKNSGDQKDARNLLIVQRVADFKLGDEKLAKEIDALESNREFNQKMDKIMEQLDNKKLRNTKNKEVMQILQDAGNKIYNLLAR